MFSYPYNANVVANNMTSYPNDSEKMIECVEISRLKMKMKPYLDLRKPSTYREEKGVDRIEGMCTE